MSESAEVETKDKVADIVREVLGKQGFAHPVGHDDDLSEAGLSSSDMVNLMLMVEEEFRITIPEQELRPVNFRSIASIDALVRSIVAGR
jgi:acyl carrier protein